MAERRIIQVDYNETTSWYIVRWEEVYHAKCRTRELAEVVRKHLQDILDSGGDIEGGGD